VKTILIRSYTQYVPEDFKLRLLKFLNNIYTKNLLQMKGEILLEFQYLRKVTELILKITEELVS